MFDSGVPFWDFRVGIVGFGILELGVSDLLLSILDVWIWDV